MIALEWPGSRLVVDLDADDLPILRTARWARIRLLSSEQRRLRYRVHDSRLIVHTPSPDPGEATTSRHAYVFKITGNARR